MIKKIIVKKYNSENKYLIYFTINEKNIACDLVFSEKEKTFSVNTFLSTYFIDSKKEDLESIIEEITLP